MFKWETIPLKTPQDLIRWHEHKLELAQKRFASRTTDPRYRNFPRQIKRLQVADQKIIDFHSQALGILKQLVDRNQRLEHAELMTQAALL